MFRELNRFPPSSRTIAAPECFVTVAAARIAAHLTSAWSLPELAHPPAMLASSWSESGAARVRRSRFWRRLLTAVDVTTTWSALSRRTASSCIPTGFRSVQFHGRDARHPWRPGNRGAKTSSLPAHEKKQGISMAGLPGGRARRPMTFLSCWWAAFRLKGIDFMTGHHDPQTDGLSCYYLLFSALVMLSERPRNFSTG